MQTAERPYANPVKYGYRALARALSPRKPLTVSQWADAERRLSGEQGLEHNPAETAGGGDDTFVVTLEQLPVYPTFVIVAF